MARRPLAADLWEQALLNGRRIHPSDDAAALSWAEAWYGAQGGGFDGPAPAAAPAAAPEPVAAAASAAEVEPVVAAAPKAPRAAKPRRRARVESGQFKGDDPATPEVNEAWEGGDAA